jgi:hypothetical protein
MTNFWFSGRYNSQNNMSLPNRIQVFKLLTLSKFLLTQTDEQTMFVMIIAIVQKFWEI